MAVCPDSGSGPRRTWNDRCDLSGSLTEITELSTALGMISPTLEQAFTRRPEVLVNVDDDTWARLGDTWRRGVDLAAFNSAFDNGRAFASADDGLRGRPPARVEWKGPHRPPGDDVVPADLRIDRVYLVSCKYLSKILLNPGPVRLFDDLLVGEGSRGANWFVETARDEFQDFYESAVGHFGVADMPGAVQDLTGEQQSILRELLRARVLPDELHEPWERLCLGVSERTADRWENNLGSHVARRRLLWRMLRISGVTYFVLGAEKRRSLRLRIDSAWDWMQTYELRSFQVEPRVAGQPEVGWRAIVSRRDDGPEIIVDGHVEIRWSHGRFRGNPEAKVYLDTPLDRVPGYHQLVRDQLV